MADLTDDELRLLQARLRSGTKASADAARKLIENIFRNTSLPADRHDLARQAPVTRRRHGAATVGKDTAERAQGRGVDLREGEAGGGGESLHGQGGRSGHDDEVSHWLKVKVIDAETGAPVANVKLVVADDGDEIGQTFVTNQRGLVEIGNLPDTTPRKVRAALRGARADRALVPAGHALAPIATARPSHTCGAWCTAVEEQKGIVRGPTRHLLEVRHHTISTETSLSEVADNCGIELDELLAFNWPGLDGESLELAKRATLGCTHKRAEMAYRLDPSDDPAVVAVPVAFDELTAIVDDTLEIRVVENPIHLDDLRVFVQEDVAAGKASSEPPPPAFLVLVSTDGAYRHFVELDDATKSQGWRVACFPQPPNDKRYHLIFAAKDGSRPYFMLFDATYADLHRDWTESWDGRSAGAVYARDTPSHSVHEAGWRADMCFPHYHLFRAPYAAAPETSSLPFAVEERSMLPVPDRVMLIDVTWVADDDASLLFGPAHGDFFDGLVPARPAACMSDERGVMYLVRDAKGPDDFEIRSHPLYAPPPRLNKRAFRMVGPTAVGVAVTLGGANRWTHELATTATSDELELVVCKTLHSQLSDPESPPEGVAETTTAQSYRAWHGGVSGQPGLWGFIFAHKRMLLLVITDLAMVSDCGIESLTVTTPLGKVLPPLPVFKQGTHATALVVGDHEELPPGLYRIRADFTRQPSALWRYRDDETVDHYELLELVTFGIMHDAGDLDIVVADPISIEESLLLSCSTDYHGQIEAAWSVATNSPIEAKLRGLLKEKGYRYPTKVPAKTGWTYSDWERACVEDCGAADVQAVWAELCAERARLRGGDPEARGIVAPLGPALVDHAERIRWRRLRDALAGGSLALDSPEEHANLALAATATGLSRWLELLAGEETKEALRGFKTANTTRRAVGYVLLHSVRQWQQSSEWTVRARTWAINADLMTAARWTTLVDRLRETGGVMKEVRDAFTAVKDFSQFPGPLHFKEAFAQLGESVKAIALSQQQSRLSRAVVSANREALANALRALAQPFQNKFADVGRMIKATGGVLVHSVRVVIDGLTVLMAAVSGGLAIKGALDYSRALSSLEAANTELDELLDAFDMYARPEDSGAPWPAFRDGIIRVEKGRLLTVHAKMNTGDKLFALVNGAIDLALAVGACIPGVQVVAGIIALVKGGLDLVVWAAEEAMVRLSAAHREEIGLIDLHRAAYANQELMVERYRNHSERALRLRAEVLTGLVSLFRRAAISAADDFLEWLGHEIDAFFGKEVETAEARYRAKLAKYYVADYIDLFVLTDWLDVPLRRAVPMTLDTYWLYMIGEGEDASRHDLAGLMHGDNFMGVIRSAGAVIAAGVNMVTDDPKSAYVDFQKKFPIHYLASDVADLAQTFRPGYAFVEADCVDHTCVYWRPYGSEGSGGWQPINAFSRKSIEQILVDGRELCPLDQIRVLVVLKEDIPKNRAYPASLQVIRCDGVNIEGPVYKAMVRELDDADLLPREEAYKHRLGVVFYPFYRFNDRDFLGLKPLGKPGWLTTLGFGKFDAHAYYRDGGLTRMRYGLSLKIGGDHTQQWLPLGPHADNDADEVLVTLDADRQWDGEDHEYSFLRNEFLLHRGTTYTYPWLMQDAEVLAVFCRAVSADHGPDKELPYNPYRVGRPILELESWAWRAAFDFVVVVASWGFEDSWQPLRDWRTVPLSARLYNVGPSEDAAGPTYDMKAFFVGHGLAQKPGLMRLYDEPPNPETFVKEGVTYPVEKLSYSPAIQRFLANADGHGIRAEIDRRLKISGRTGGRIYAAHVRPYYHTPDTAQRVHGIRPFGPKGALQGWKEYQRGRVQPRAPSAGPEPKRQPWEQHEQPKRPTHWRLVWRDFRSGAGAGLHQPIAKTVTEATFDYGIPGASRFEPEFWLPIIPDGIVTNARLPWHGTDWERFQEWIHDEPTAIVPGDWAKKKK